ncbi:MULTISPECIES: hypothetical protein [unclassified Nostoc]|uniref:hypothetical protein n=1 Tax=unclassified Nostoc TaxID=2593658 RepID=UPI002AD552CB|nr:MULTISPECIES: hypothetical protein [unclassified Nostoc]MDZ8121285.1 hypothetical protein [Nostoc sp. CmiVER01]MDZ8224216.1 hypothetical protein [Nostoc sp. ChiVER01]
MSQESEFPFERARRVTPEENQKFRDAIAHQFGINLINAIALSHKPNKYDRTLSHQPKCDRTSVTTINA